MNILKRKKAKDPNTWNVRNMFGPGLNFAAAEAYKLLRTNLMFSFSGEQKCRVVGVTSAIEEEGKSTVICNLAYSVSQSGASVLLIDGDLRKPTIASKLGVNRVPGLTNLLVSREDYKKFIQQSAHAPSVDLLTAGDIPPNPSELLSSGRMQEVIQQMCKDYDYILIDLPPVTVVSDALAISKNLDGAVMVVRGGVSDQQMLAEALRQLELVNVPVLGFVYRENDASGKKYGSRYGKKYYKYYKAYEKKK